MKKILFGLAMIAGGLLSAQYYPQSPSGYGNQQYPTQYGNSYDDGAYFPDDYYYEYPEDYYDNSYYTSFYNDYYNSIQQVNWNRFFSEYRVPRPTINLIIQLNNQFPSFSSWNSYYRMNPRRWWYDRFYALEHILGPQLFVIFQRQYYQGYNPVVYYNNYWNQYYRPRYRVRPVYAHININRFRIDPALYHQSVGTNFGFNQPRSNNYRGGFVDGAQNGGFQSNNGGFKNRTADFQRDNNGFRNGQQRSAYDTRGDRGGFRDAQPQVVSPRPQAPRSQSEGGFRGGRNENSSPRIERSTPSAPSGGGFRGESGRGGGFRNI